MGCQDYVQEKHPTHHAIALASRVFLFVVVKRLTILAHERRQKEERKFCFWLLYFK